MLSKSVTVMRNSYKSAFLQDRDENGCLCIFYRRKFDFYRRKFAF